MRTLYVLMLSIATAINSSSHFGKTMDELPHNIDSCHALLREQFALINEFTQSQAALIRQVEELTLTVKHLLEGKRREIFINPAQGLLEFPDDPELQDALEQAKHEAKTIVDSFERRKADKPKRSEAFPAHLRREVVDVPVAADKQQLLDDGKMVFVRHEIREMLKFKRPEVYVVQYRQPVLAYVNEPAKGIYTAPRPMAIGDEGRYDASVGATITASKFGFHLPYYRLQDVFGASGWTPSRSTIDHITSETDFILEPVVELMKARLLTSQVIGLDDTHVTLLMPPDIPKAEPGDLRMQRLIEKMLEAQSAGKPSIDAKMWVYSGMVDQPYDVFDFRVSRHRDGPAEFLDGYQGNVMADCYSGNLSVILDSKSAMTRMACWSHARRKLFESKDNHPASSVLPLALISQLYDIERRIIDASVDERTQVRVAESTKILAQLRHWIDGPIAKSILPQSGFGKAVNYLVNHWSALQVFASDGRLPIDNNPIERLMKRVATGRKNWLFVGSVRAGMRNARLMSLVSSAHRHDLDVEMYLDDALRQILGGSTDYKSLLPDIWKQAHPSAIRTYRTEERHDKADRSKLQAALRRQLNQD